MTIYLDAVWLLNLFLDWLLLLCTQLIAKGKISHWRIALGAAAASLIVPLTIFFPDSLFTHPLVKIGYSLLIIFTAFGFTSIGLFLKRLLLFYFVTFAVGGSLIAVHFLLQSNAGFAAGSFLVYQTGYGDRISWLFVIVAFPIACYFTKNRMDKQTADQFRYDQMYETSLTINDKTISTMGFADSGNQLVDPLTKRPVVIGDEKLLKNWFDDQTWMLLKKAQEEVNLEYLPAEWLMRFSFVPYQGVSGSSGLMLVLKPDSFSVIVNKEKVETNSVFIGFQFGLMTADDSYHCLLHPLLLQHATITAV